MKLFDTLAHFVQNGILHLFRFNLDRRRSTAVQREFAVVYKAVIHYTFSVGTVIEVHRIATAGTFHHTHKPRVHSLAVCRKLALVRLPVLHSQPRFRRNKPLMICDLDEISLFTACMNEQSVDTVIRVNIVKHFISFGKKIAVDFFVSPHIKRIFKDTAQVRPVKIGNACFRAWCRS